MKINKCSIIALIQNAELAATPILWPLDAKNWLTGKDPGAGKDWRREEKGTTEDEMVGWHHQLDGPEFEQALGVGDEQGSLAAAVHGVTESDKTSRLPCSARLPCSSPTPRACSNSCPLSQWYHPTISSSVVSFSSRLWSFPVSGSLPMSQFFTSGGQSIGVSASASVLSMNSQGWFPLGLSGFISLQSKGLSRVFSNTTVQNHQFFCWCWDTLMTKVISSPTSSILN